MIIDPSAYTNIVVLTGAGISVASGLRTYRGPGGLWDQPGVQRYTSIEGLRENPQRCWDLFGARRDAVLTAQPNAGHVALARLEASLRDDQRFLLVTQNVDGLHQRAGSRNVVEIHGNVGYTRCMNDRCDLPRYADAESHSQSLAPCPRCGSALRPDIVLFGEMLSIDAMRKVRNALAGCDLFIAVGTSGVVTPAATFVEFAAMSGARTVYVNLQPMEPRNLAFHEEHLGRAEELLPRLLGQAEGTSASSSSD